MCDDVYLCSYAVIRFGVLLEIKQQTFTKQTYEKYTLNGNTTTDVRFYEKIFLLNMIIKPANWYQFKTM